MTPPMMTTALSQAFRSQSWRRAPKVVGKATRLEKVENELLRLSITSAELVGEIATRLAANDASGTKLRVVLEMRAKGFLAGMFYPIIAQTVGTNLPEQVETFGSRLEG